MASGTFDGKFVIDKLNGSNYGIWSMKVKMMLQKDDFWGLIDGTDVLAAEATPAQQVTYNKKVAKATATIGLTIDDSFLLMIDDKVTPKDKCNCTKSPFSIRFTCK